LDNVPCGLVQTTEQGLFQRVNKTFCQWLGLTAEELVGQRRFQDLLTMGGRIFHQTHWAPLLKMQGSISEVKLELVHQNGGIIPMVLNACKREENGQTVHEIAAFVAWDRDKYEKELVRSRKRLEELVKESNQHQSDAKDRAEAAEQMIGIVSHDLRNPLSSINMAAALLERSGLSPTQQRHVTRITRSSSQAKFLIGDLLDFTQARLGKGLSISMTQIALHDVVAQSIEELAGIYPGRALQHRRNGDGNCVADPNRLSQLLGNLVSNAMTYGNPHTPVTVTSSVENTSVFSISVHNEGPAVPDEKREALFEPMTRGAAGGGSHRSVGLGLFIVREIAKAHGGSVQVRSSPTEGTTFLANFRT
jgi:sigma-B regulation protein RsbU (phosphoserine phosphatase)